MDRAERESINWVLQYKDLTKYTSWRAAPRYGWPANDVFRDLAPEDVAHEAIEKLLNGDRVWDKERVPDLQYFLRKVVDSLLSNHADSAYVKKREFPTIKASKDRGKEEDMVDPLDSTVPSSAKGDRVIEELVARETSESAAKLIQRIEDAIASDEELALLLMCIKDGITKSREIEDAVGIPSARVSELKRKLEQKASRALRGSKSETETSLIEGEKNAG